MMEAPPGLSNEEPGTAAGTNGRKKMFDSHLEAEAIEAGLASGALGPNKNASLFFLGGKKWGEGCFGCWMFFFGVGGGGDFVSVWYVFWRFELEEVMMV